MQQQTRYDDDELVTRSTPRCCLRRGRCPHRPAGLCVRAAFAGCTRCHSCCRGALYMRPAQPPQPPGPGTQRTRFGRIYNPPLRYVRSARVLFMPVPGGPMWASAPTERLRFPRKDGPFHIPYPPAGGAKCTAPIWELCIFPYFLLPRYASRGKVTVMAVPLPSVLWSSTRARWNWAACFTIDRPRPVPETSSEWLLSTR